MIQHDVAFREARDIVAKGRSNLGLPNGVDWTAELKAECLRLLEESSNPGDYRAGVDTYTETKENDDAISFEGSSRPPIMQWSKGEMSHDHKMDDDEEDEEHENTIRQTIVPVNVYISPQPPKRKPKIGTPLQKLRDLQRLESVGTDSSYLIQPLSDDESSMREIDDGKNHAGRSPRGRATRNGPNILATPEPVNPKCDETHATEESTVEGGIPSVIYIFINSDRSLDGSLSSHQSSSRSLLSRLGQNFRSMSFQKRSKTKIRLDEDDVESYARTLVVL